MSDIVFYKNIIKRLIVVTGQAAESMNLSPRLQELGFIRDRDPFSYPEAEKMPDDINLWERLFVEHPGFNKVKDVNKSAVLLAEHGGGKTAHRLYFSRMLAAQRPSWLIVTYASFSLLAPKLPNISTSDHFDILMARIAEALLAYISEPNHKEDFLEKRRLPTRKWFWAFLKAYSDKAFQYELDCQLTTDFAEMEKMSLPLPFRQSTPLDIAIKNIVQHLHSLGVTRLFLLVDGVDGSDEFKRRADMRALVNPLLNGLSLLSIPGVVWKFFLPKSLETAVLDSSGYKTGRLSPISIEWDQESLAKLLNERLKWASEGLYQRIEDLCSQELLQRTNVERELIKMATRHKYLGSPRALLSLSRQLCS
ncbi:MAG TPA: hypothetical protein EYH05_21610 [Anaerolineae bacterium]|nr:hypothetical protein [Anaerolineae bacterium]